MNLFSTIAAISTPYGTGGISIIRISGSRALEIADKVFKASSKKKLAHVPSHTIHHGHIVSAEGKVLDEVLASVMLSPRTYTGEDTVELNCHGGLFTTKRILEEVLKAGAENASRGEFTKRAFLNGKTDLARAEAVIDLINSKTNLEQSISVNHLGGALSAKINSLRERLITLLAHVQVLIDYPDEELEPLSEDEFLRELKEIKNESAALLATSEAGSLIKNGIATAIVGKPNVGKSSLLNALIGEDRAIVTSVKGTTRDTIHETITYSGIKINFIDTAGIHESDDQVESIGIEKSKQSVENAHIVLAVFDASEPLDKEDKQIINLTNNKKVINILNKTDISKNKTELNGIQISALNKQGINLIKDTILNTAIETKIDFSGLIITNERHIQTIKQALKQIDQILKDINFQTVDILDMQAKELWQTLGKITGETENEDIISGIFAKFCLGK